MFVRVLCCSLCALLASPASAEFVVQDGDYYEELTDFGVGIQPIRITGGRVDRLLGFGGSSSVTIEGGSIGTIRSGGNLELHLRGGGFQIDNPVIYDDGPMADSDVIFLFFEDVFSIHQSMSAGNQWDYAAWFSDFTYAEFSVVRDPQFCRQPEPGSGYPFDLVCGSPDDTFNLVDHLPGDAQGDGVVDLTDLNNVRNYFGSQLPEFAWLANTNGDCCIDLEDLNNVRNNFGADYRNSSNPVPEPSALVLTLLAAVLVCVLRIRAIACRSNTTA